MPLRRLAVLALLFAAASSVGCGGTSTSNERSGDFRGEQRLVANTVEDLESAASDGEPDKICRDLLAQSLARRMAAAGRSCAATVDAALEDTDTFKLTVRSVRIAGDRATVRVRLETGERDRGANVRLARERGRWRIASL